MDIDLPGTVASQQRASLEDELTAVFTALLADSRGAKDTVVEIYNVCHERVEAIRAEAAEQLHRPARHMTLKALAEEMEAQAATWHLLFCLYCDEAAPAGDGGDVLQDAGGVMLHRQRLADCVAADQELARCARVVAWLESLAEDGLKRQGGAAFAPGEGLWHETRTEMRAGTGSVVSELDPDAPGRSGRPLHTSNARSQERILARVWQLMRAGKLRDALELCQHVGQPWRAAALGGGGQYGSLPVGAAAVEHDEVVGLDQQAEELADEVSNGSGTLLALWRWSSLQAAAAPPGDKFERAVFGALGGNTAAMAPACGSWEDFAWTYCRSWLESQLSRAAPLEPHAAGDLVAGDAVATALVRCGVAPIVAQRNVEAAMSVVLGTAAGGAAAGAAPYDGGDSAAAAATSSRGFSQLFAQHVMAPGSMVYSGAPAVQALRLVQGLLVQGDMHALACHLYGILVDRRGADGDVAAMDDGSGAAATVSATSPERRWRTCALAAHMLLALEGLGVLATGGYSAGAAGAVSSSAPAGGVADAFEVHKTLDLSQRLLVFYVATLLERGQLALVPPYLCALRPALRSSLCGELLALHTRRLTGLDAVGTDTTAAASSEDARAADVECYGAFAALDEWFRRCVERQQQPQEELASRLVTDVRPNELRIQLATFALACRHSRTYGPHQRARVARWLAYPYIAAVQAAAAEDEQNRQEANEDGEVAPAAVQLDPTSYYDVLDYAACLCCELALGDDVTAAAGHLLFDEVLPEDLEMAALVASDALADSTAAAAASLGLDADGGALNFLQEQQQHAAEEADAALRLAAQLRDHAAELASWRLFYKLDAQLARWSASHEALADGGAWPNADAAAEVEALVLDGGALLQAYLEQLLQTGWQQELAAPERALAAAAAVEGVVRVTLTVTSPPGPGSSLVPSTGSAWGQPTAPYPELQGAALYAFTVALQSGLQRAAAAAAAQTGGAVDVKVEGPADAGHATVSLAAAADPQSWHALVGLVCGAVRGNFDSVPPLLLVGLEADRATSLAVCRRCCIGQAVMRCAGLRLSLVALGADAESAAAGPQLLEMLAAPPEVSGGLLGSGTQGLVDLLTPAQLQHVLVVEADTVEQHLRNKQRY